MPIDNYQSTEIFENSQLRFRELHLYQGSLCNRACDFCTVFGTPDGWYADYTEAILNQTLRMMDMDGHIKFYGGEPTIKHKNQIWAMQYLRSKGFIGKYTIFSNGIKADALIEIMESDNNTDCALNYSIWTGRGATPIPIPAKKKIQQYAKTCPNRFFLAHPDIIGSGRAMDWDLDNLDVPTFGDTCPLCHPVVTTKGEILACPFNVEKDSDYHKLGNINSNPDDIMQNYKDFRTWVDKVLHPASQSTGKKPCYFCNHQPESLEPPKYVNNGNTGNESVIIINYHNSPTLK